MKSACRKVPLIRNLLVVVMVLMSAGCGDVEWFPAYERLPTTPDEFSFPAKTGVAFNTTVTSDPITVAGLTADSSPISITGPVGSNSKYAINTAAATDAAGTVKNGDKVTVSHTSGNAAGITITSVLTIGNINGRFSSTTQTVTPPVFTPKTAPAGRVVDSDPVIISSVDGIPGTHVISIKDNLDSANALYSFDNTEFFTNITQTVPILNGRVLVLRNRTSATPGAVVTTTLTIDGVSSTFVLTTQ
ncbi:MAG: hypothetical protein A2075_18250 [Geobacteraceae bacterium GWC2_58_44]|nr:MAG: hypothetical protein A2075_18250 [Geobacteraceae bacterium GWC2_58_44]HBG08173.1 hypothetical protein [Geobacter sp.]